jgi:hypothetical protein
MRFTEDDFFFEESSSVDDVGFFSFARPEVKELPDFGIGVFQKLLNFGTALYHPSTSLDVRDQAPEVVVRANAKTGRRD